MGRYNYTNAFDRLISWANREGYDIVIDHHDTSTIEWENKTLNSPNRILIEGQHPIEIKVYLLLHELGHHQLRKDWDRFKQVLPFTAHAEHVHVFEKVGKFKRRVDYDVSCMEEEFKAWDEGYKLGQRLNIRINERKWHEFKAKCLLTYMRYYSSKKH